jgi:protocatechuate 3,4-dioxygenase beta subunit
VTANRHDHDRGLAHDLPRLLGRRRALTLLGGFGAAVVVGCGGDDSAEPAPANGSGDCTPTPYEDPGPSRDGTSPTNALHTEGIVRSDIRSSFGSATAVAEGIPLEINLVLEHAGNDCAAIRGAAVYLWQCDRDGNYSMYSSGLVNENYLRGVQPSDDNGRLTFQSIFPGCYVDRWPHIHFEVFESVEAAVGDGRRYTATQLALPIDVCNVVYATKGYETSVPNLAGVTLDSDVIFGDDGGVTQLAEVSGDPGAGYTLELAVRMGGQ